MVAVAETPPLGDLYEDPAPVRVLCALTSVTRGALDERESVRWAQKGSRGSWAEPKGANTKWYIICQILEIQGDGGWRRGATLILQ